MTTIDQTAVKAGDTVTVTGKTTVGDTYEITGKVWEPTHSLGSLWVGPVAIGSPMITITDHQPEWKPGTFGTARVNTTDNDPDTRARGFVNEDGGFTYWSGIASFEAADLIDFVPDETCALPTREQVVELLNRSTLSYPALADALLALLRGESR